MKTLHIKNLSSLILLLATSLFASFSHAEGTVQPQIKFRATTSSSSCTSIRTADHASYKTTRDEACDYQTSGATSSSETLGDCNGYSRNRCYNGTTFTAYNSVVPICPANSTVSGNVCACNAGYGPDNGQCVEGATLTPQEQCEANNQYWYDDSCHDNPQNPCATLPADDITLAVKVIDDSSNQLTVTDEMATAVEHNGCQYFKQSNYPVGQTELDCFTFTSDPEPKAGYCHFSYSPSYAEAPTGTQSALDGPGTIDPPQTCIDGDITPFGYCKMNCDINTEWANTETTICEPRAVCGTNETYNSTNNTCSSNNAGTPSCPATYPRSTHTGTFAYEQGNLCVYANEICSNNPLSVKGLGTSACLPLVERCTQLGYGADTTLGICTGTSNDNAQIANYLTPDTQPKYCDTGLPYNGGTQCGTLDEACPPQNGQSAIDYNAYTEACTYPNDAPDSGDNTGSASGNGDCADEPEKCQKLQDIYDLLEGTKAPTDLTADLDNFDTELDDAMGDFGVGEDGSYNNDITDGLLDNFRNSEAVTTLYDNYKLINPATVFLDEASDCTLNTTWDGVVRPISICDIQDELHTIISFILGVGLYFGIRGLMEERPA